MRVALFSDSVLPVLNGVSVSVESLVSELRNKGHSVHIFAPQFPGLIEPDPNTYRFRSIEMPFGKGFPLAYPPYIRMLRRFRRHEFDVIHTHTIGILGFVGLRWAESHGLPIVATPSMTGTPTTCRTCRGVTRDSRSPSTPISITTAWTT
jgi:glycosyltransferase involved in cell wall biosynthesis